MGGGLMQLVAYGAQDVYLTGNPQITFFKVVYRRHTNFSMESIEQVFNGTPNFGKKVSCTISRNGDLAYKTYIQVTLPEVDADTWTTVSKIRWTPWVGHALIDWVEIEIGGQSIDKHYGDWLHIWNELSQPTGRQTGYSDMLGNVPKMTLYPAIISSGTSYLPGSASPATYNPTPEKILYIPLEFWFCKNPGLALPLIALQYHEIKINVKFNPLSNILDAVVTETSPTTVYTARSEERR